MGQALNDCRANCRIPTWQSTDDSAWNGRSLVWPPLVRHPYDGLCYATRLLVVFVPLSPPPSCLVVTPAALRHPQQRLHAFHTFILTFPSQFKHFISPLPNKKKELIPFFPLRYIIFSNISCTKNLSMSLLYFYFVYYIVPSF